MVLRRSSQRATNYFHDFLLGISTTGTAPSELPGQVYYATVSYSCTKSVIRKIDLAKEDTFVDVGKGRVVCLVAKHDIPQAIGIEYSPERASAAERNVKRLRGRNAPARILCQAAEEADYSEATVLYFFNPFDPSILDAVLDKVRADRQDRPTRIAYVAESEGHMDVFSRHKWLTCYERFEDKDKHVIAFYRTAAPG